MYSRARFISDFSWTAVPQCSFGPHRWVMPGEGWFSFIPESWIAPVYSGLVVVDAVLRRTNLSHLFSIHRIEIDDALHVWYGFYDIDHAEYFHLYDLEKYASCDLDELAYALQEIEDAFAYMTYVTSLISLDAELIDDSLSDVQGRAMSMDGAEGVSMFFPGADAM